MHKLDRNTATAPTCLSNYQHPTHTWDHFGSNCKSELRAALVQMQGIPGVTTPGTDEYGVRCAYCEGAIRHEGHIEHFRRKNPKNGFPQLTFAWGNLFLACGSKEHCGHYKDKEAWPYDANDLIKPDQDNPEQFLYFHSNGEVRKREKLSSQEEKRAEETIRVFGLDNSALVGARSKAVKSLKEKLLGELEEIKSWSTSEREDYIRGEIDAARWDPYATTIKHFLQKKI